MPNCIILHSHEGFHCGSAGKESVCNVGDLGSIPGLGRSPREGKGYPLQYSALENSTDCMVHGVARSWTQLSNFTFIAIYESSKFFTSSPNLVFIFILFFLLFYSHPSRCKWFSGKEPTCQCR